jgi:predicted ribosome quality control (RQC) complex YloA/Tae2 family protein
MDHSTSSPDHDSFEQIKEKIDRRIRKKIEKVQEGIALLKQQYLENALWEQTSHDADLLKNYFSAMGRGIDRVEVIDWITNQRKSIQVDPLLSPEDNLAHLYKKARKMKRSLDHLERQIAKKQKEEAAFEATLERLAATTEMDQLLPFRHFIPPLPKKPGDKIAPKPPYKTIMTPSGCKILYGKSAGDNDFLTFQVARGSDLWMHVSGVPGSHVIVQAPRGIEVDEESIQLAMQIALRNSKARDRGEAEVVVTQRKFVAKMRGAPKGQVSVSTHKKRYVRFDSTLWKTMFPSE